MLDMNDLWARIDELVNADGPPGLGLPVVLKGEDAAETLTQVQCAGLIAGLRTQADAEITAEGRARRSRSRRNFKQAEIYEAMKIYRQAMPQAMPSGNDLQGTLPRVLPQVKMTPGREKRSDTLPHSS